MVARRVVADGRLNGVVIVPTGEWGNRVGAAFADELKSLGGTVLDSRALRFIAGGLLRRHQTGLAIESHQGRKG